MGCFDLHIVAEKVPQIVIDLAAQTEHGWVLAEAAYFEGRCFELQIVERLLDSVLVRIHPRSVAKLKRQKEETA